MKKLSANERGDTIVEVLISITILAFVLTGAYLTAIHSYNNIITSQDRDQATYIAQNQLEILVAQADNLFYTGSPYENYATQSGGFCFDVNSSDASYSNNNYHLINGPCTSNQLVDISPGPEYQVAISSGPNSCANLASELVGNPKQSSGCYVSAYQTPTYVVQVSWYGPGSSPEQLQLYYRLGGNLVVPTL
jgi:Tfp pilus assembly protein PilV